MAGRVYMCSMCVFLAFAAAPMSGCSQGRGEQGKAVEDYKAEVSASVRIEPTQGNQVEGSVTFERVSGGVRVVARIDGLKPGLHGFHVHTNGDCSAPDASSAGDHFNPNNGSHADRYDEQAHIGDMGNIVAEESGHASLEYVDPHMALDGAASIIGRSVVVHANEDDLQTQPSGNSGPRVGCGVIRPGTG